ncbi:cob(I)yrinic acid a,c-diamide adenosyltransferase [Eubacteriales bacterium OttesenSCG-928-K08]|nr:cob(I)yrinic acid a,c-diamide adenosyltransferase [Eubacteriales bacterium OttesenSCG-928-K08]
MSGCIHIYTGEGKGKTTAAMGLALRAAGQGRAVVIVQFLKGSDTGELRSLKHVPGITILRNSRDFGFYSTQPEEVQRIVYQENDANFCAALELVENGQCDFLILDEALPAYQLNALNKAALESFVKNKPAALELVLTGRGAPEHFIALADYVSDIQKVKHPFDRGIKARQGVEF